MGDIALRRRGRRACEIRLWGGVRRRSRARSRWRRRRPRELARVRTNRPVGRAATADAGTETYRAVEGAKGELGIYLRSDGTDTPARFKIRSPCFSNLQALPEMAEREYVPDLVATLGSLDTIMREVDR